MHLNFLVTLPGISFSAYCFSNDLTEFKSFCKVYYFSLVLFIQTKHTIFLQNKNITHLMVWTILSVSILIEFTLNYNNINLSVIGHLLHFVLQASLVKSIQIKCESNSDWVILVYFFLNWFLDNQFPQLDVEDKWTK